MITSNPVVFTLSWLKRTKENIQNHLVNTCIEIVSRQDVHCLSKIFSRTTLRLTYLVRTTDKFHSIPFGGDDKLIYELTH